MNKSYIQNLLDNNQKWVKEKLSEDPNVFERSAEGQTPKVLWLGCSDSRVPPNEITGTGKGEFFVHRNIANLVAYTDLNFLSVLQYAVQHLKVQHIIVCGHYGCGGVQAAMSDKDYGLLDHWLLPIRDLMHFYHDELEKVEEGPARFNRMVELSVKEQVNHLGNTNIVLNAWKEGEFPYLHAWVYDLSSGKILPQVEMVNNPELLKEHCKYEKIKA
jgi:carbonic anhydrase